ncbi:uncharacterized protein LOC143296426 isoform X2 [Babylonia areolata]
MIWGQCQHRVCADCLYDESGCLRQLFIKCPVCQHRWSFPQKRPEIPEDNVEMMRCLGVRSCPNQSKGCTMDMWEWEMEEHIRSCEWKPESPPKKSRSRSTSSQKEKRVPASTRVTRSGRWLRAYCNSGAVGGSAD